MNRSTKLLCAAAGIAGFLLSSVGAQAATSYSINAQDDIYQAGQSDSSDGQAPVAISVVGLSALTFSNSGFVTLDSGSHINDADGVGAAPYISYNTGFGGISGLTAYGAGFVTGVFEGPTLNATAPTALDFTATGTNFTSLSPELQQAFFIGDGLTGDGTGTTQTFYVPAGATELFLGISDACGYDGAPSCYGDNHNVGAVGFTAQATGVMAGSVSAAPEPGTWALMLGGLAMIGGMLRIAGARRRENAVASAVTA